MNKPLSIYVASSLRNESYPEVVMKLREAGLQVYDFRNPRLEEENGILKVAEDKTELKTR